MPPIPTCDRWQGLRASAKVGKGQVDTRGTMSGTGLRNLSLALLVALMAYVAWSGGM